MDTSGGESEFAGRTFCPASRFLCHLVFAPELCRFRRTSY
jgi:hypothetical protein